MLEALDQLPILIKAALLNLLPIGARPWASAFLSVVPLLVLFPLLFAITTVLERKGLGRIQNRYGPNRVGPFGFLQPIADGIKSLTKEDIVPFRADPWLHFLAPVILVVPAFLALAVLPMGRNLAAVDLDAGLLFFFAIGSATELAVFLAGWSSRNKYSLLGALRAIAQMISYELPLILSTVPVVMVAGSLSTMRIVEAQEGYWGWIPRWHLFSPWGLAAFLLFLVAAIAESNRSPFDLPEGESEIVAGYFLEYSGFKFALFFLGEYIGMFAVSGMATTLFLGGWQAPLPFLTWVPSYVWFFTKLMGFILFFIWIRGTLPRLRMDQLMQFAWKFMIPVALFNLVLAGAWHRVVAHATPLGAALLGVGGVALLVAAYRALARHYFSARGYGRRTYRYAD